MDEKFTAQLFEAIKKDDLKGFGFCMEKASCGAYRFGRFPLLSVLYLYNSKKIIASYQDKLIKYNSWEQVDEPLELATEFRKRAGKCLRLYLDEVVSPCEMLLILDQTNKLKKLYSQFNVSAAAKQRLKDIYNIKYGLNVSYQGNQIQLDRRPLTKAEKTKILLAAVSVVLCLAIIVSTPFVVNVFAPFIPDENGILTVAKASSIKFSSEKSYLLKDDIELTATAAKDFNCNLDGNGKTITIPQGVQLFTNMNGTIANATINVVGQKDSFSTDTIIGTLNGKLDNITLNTDYPVALVDKVHYTASITDLVLNARLSSTVTQSFALVANDNLGQIKNCTVNISGKITVESVSEEQSQEEFLCCGMVLNNNQKYINVLSTARGLIDNCTVNCNGLQLVGATTANAQFGGIVGNNDSALLNSTVNGSISAYTFDVAGVCVNNNYALISDTNNANITQQSDQIGWNPLASGIVLINTYGVESCTNNGNISSVSVCGPVEDTKNDPSAIAAGIAYISRSVTNSPYIDKCTNNGNISCSAINRKVLAAGICVSSSGRINICQNLGDVSGTSEGKNEVYVSGIAGFAYAYVLQCQNEGNVVAQSADAVYVGGIASICYAQVSYCKSRGNINANGDKCYVGGILGSSNVITATTYIYGGTAENCISQNAITATGTTFCAAGGITGYIAQQKVVTDQEEYYFGGSVRNCYFTGNLLGKSSYGCIVGVCSKAVHDRNSFLSTAGDQKNFQDNFATVNVHSAFASLYEGDEEFTYLPGDNLSLTLATAEEISSQETYKAILQKLSGQ